MLPEVSWGGRILTVRDLLEQNRAEAAVESTYTLTNRSRIGQRLLKKACGGWAWWFVRTPHLNPATPPRSTTRLQHIYRQQKRLRLCNLRESRDKACGEGGLGHKTDTGGLERAEGDICEELAKSGRSEVDGGTVVLCGIVAKQINALLPGGEELS